MALLLKGNTHNNTSKDAGKVTRRVDGSLWLLLLLFIASLFMPGNSGASGTQGFDGLLQETKKTDREAASTALSRMFVPFEENRGQVGPEVAFMARTVAGPLHVTQKGELVWNLRNRATSGQWTLTERFVVGRTVPRGHESAPTRVSSFRGNDPAHWVKGARTYKSISLGETWEGIDVSLAAKGKNVEKIFTVLPGADPTSIRVAVDGASLEFTDSGSLMASTPIGSLEFTPPVAYQEIKGKRLPVQVAYCLADNGYGFTVGAYDQTKPLVIDPLLQATYLGGARSDTIKAIAATASGVYVAGSADGVAFVALLNPDLTTLIHTTYLDGIDSNALAVTGTGVYVAGEVYDIEPAPQAFVALLSINLTSVVRHVFFKNAVFPGGSTLEVSLLPQALAVSDTGVYVAGWTQGGGSPGTLGGAQPFGGGGATDAYLALFNLDLTDLIQATYLGGNSRDNAAALAISGPNVYVAGQTRSDNFPGTTGSAQQTYAGGNDDGFVAMLSTDLKTLIRATYLGGMNPDSVTSLMATPTTVYAAGETHSRDLPGAASGAQSAYHGNGDGFIALLSQDLTTLTRSTYLGGTGNDATLATAQSGTGILVAGATGSTDFPGTGSGVQPATGGGYDGFIAQLSNDLTTLNAATYLGGSAADFAYALASTATGLYAAGATDSTNLPGTAGGAQPALFDQRDGFVAMFSTIGTSAQLRSLNVTRSGAGTGNVTSSPAGITCGTDCSESYALATEVTLTAVPGVASSFIGWSGACTGTTQDCTVTMDAARSVTAAFAVVNPNPTYTVTVTSTGTITGTVTSNEGGISYVHPGTTTATSSPIPGGTGVVLTARADPGPYGTIYAQWTSCPGVISDNMSIEATCTFPSLSGNLSAEAKFADLQIVTHDTENQSGASLMVATENGILSHWAGLYGNDASMLEALLNVFGGYTPADTYLAQNYDYWHGAIMKGASGDAAAAAVWDFSPPVVIATNDNHVTPSTCDISRFTGSTTYGDYRIRYATDSGELGDCGKVRTPNRDYSYEMSGGLIRVDVEVSTHYYAYASIEMNINVEMEGTIGTQVTISGGGFGTKKGKVLIGNAAAKIITWTPSSITCEIKKVLPLGAHPIEVKPKEPKGAPIVNAGTFTMMPPDILSVDPNSGAEGGTIHIAGSYFGTKKGKIYLEVPGGKPKSCKVTSWGMDSITFAVPKTSKSFPAGTYPLMVTNKVGPASTSPDFTVLEPGP